MTLSAVRVLSRPPFSRTYSRSTISGFELRHAEAVHIRPHLHHGSVHGRLRFALSTPQLRLGKHRA
jgi:hypothetical protein